MESPSFSEDQALLNDIPDNHVFLQEKEIIAAVPSDISDTSRNQLESTVVADIQIQDDVYNCRTVPSPIYEDEEPLEGEEYFDEYDPNFDENEMELAEEDYHTGSVPYILNDDELVYPLQYGDDWIEESFDLKEYGIETVFSGSEADVHGLNINEEFDEDIRRAIDFNINNFEEAAESFIDDQNLTTESFKTLSDNTPTQSKLTDKEHDSWSTADADSIADDHDDVLAKIDEILAEDFGYGKLDYFDDKQGSRDVGRLIEEEDDDYYQGSPIDSPYKEETENLQVNNFVCQSSTETRSSPEVAQRTSPDVPVTSEDSRLTERYKEDSSFLFKDVFPSSYEITQFATDEMKETVKMRKLSEEIFEAKEALKESLSSAASEKIVKLEGTTEKIDVSIKEPTEWRLTPEKTEISSSEVNSEFLSAATSVLPEVALQSKSPEKVDASLDEAVKLRPPSEEISASSSKVMKLKSSSEKAVFSEEIVSLKVASNKIDISSEETVLQSSTEIADLSSEEPAKLHSLDKTDLPTEKVIKLKESSEEISVSSGNIMGKSEETVSLKASVDKTVTTSEGMKLKSPTEKATLPSEETVKLQACIKNDLSMEKAVILKTSSEEIDVSSEKVVEKTSEKSVSSEKVVEKTPAKKSVPPKKIVEKSSEKEPLSPEKVMERSPEKKSALQEKVVEKSPEKKSLSSEKIVKKSSEKKPLSPEKVVEKSSEKKSASQEKVVEKFYEKSVSEEEIVEKPSEKKSVLPEKEVEESLEKALPSDEAKKLKTSLAPASSEEAVKLKSSSEKVAVFVEDTVNLTSSKKSSLSSKEELTLKLTAEKTDRPSEEAVKLKSSPGKTSVSEEGDMELKKTEISSEKILKLETSSEKTGQSLEGEAPTLPPKKSSLLSEETVKSKLSAEDGDLRAEKDIKLKEPSKEIDISSEITAKKSTKKMSISLNETVELKSSPEKISTSLEEAKKLEIAPEVVPSSPDEVKKLKASSEKTNVPLEELEKSKSSLHKTAVSSEETVKLKVTTEKTDVLSKDIVTQKSSTETDVLSLDKTVKLKTSSEKSCASSSEELVVKLPSEKATVFSEEIIDSKLSSEKSSCNETVKLQSPLEKTVSSEETVESKASLKKPDTLEDNMKPTSSFEETSVTSAEVKPDIPLKKKHANDLRGQAEQPRKISVSEADSDSSQSISDIPTESESKPNIPDKTRRRSRPKPETVSEDERSRRHRPKPEVVTKDEEPRRRRPKPETTSEEEGSRRCRPKPETVSEDEVSYPKAPALPRKRPKRDSSTESLSSSVFLSSSSESLSSFETASLKESSKSDSLPSKTSSSVSEDAPEIPARKAKVKSLPIRQRKRENSEDSSSASAISKSSLKSCDLPPKEAMDLCRKRTSIDERMIKLQNEGKCNTKEKAFIAAKLIEMQFEEEDALLASRQCNSVYHAVKFLTQLCEMCNCRFPINLMASMVYCTHRACKECFKAHFTSLIYDRSVFTLLCPICSKPDITDQNIQEYFNHLDMLFRNILDSHVYDLFQRKLRDEVLTKDPNFHWCSQCSSGFIASPRLKKLYCPDCSAITCALCHQTWELEHEGVHCERFQQWKDMHTPEPPPAGLVKYLADRGVTCPSCELVYPQACGGCLMYKCSHCSFEFCGFCSRPYKRGKDCGNKSCESRGIHCHHPYSCLFFLRDIEMSDLQMLLEEESVTYLTIPPKDQIVKSRCQVREQKHIHGSFSEDRCGRDIVPYCAGLCRTHYYEYLAELFRKKEINPLPIMTTRDLQFILRKSRVLVPDRVKGETNDDYYKRLTEVISNTLT